MAILHSHSNSLGSFPAVILNTFMCTNLMATPNKRISFREISEYFTGDVFSEIDYSDSNSKEDDDY